MGFVLSIFYFVTYYLTPAYLFGSLADAHIEVIVVVLVFLVSLPGLMKSFLLKNTQVLALMGLAVAVFMSGLIGRHWAGGGVKAFFSFIPNAMAYVLVCLHCTSKKRMQVLVLMLFLVCVNIIAHGYNDLRQGVPANAPPPGMALGGPVEVGATASPYLLRQMNNEEHWTYRLQGLGEINDPNDFGQLLVCIIPLMFIFWRTRNFLTNILFVFLPVSVLLFGVFLTHSRGALVALTALAILAARRRIGTVPALVLAGIMFAGALAFNFTGGRDISASAGEDRTALWGEGIALLKSHPLFGVGFGDLWEFTESYLTAHNSVIVCAAELGVFGLFFWSLYLFSTMRDAIAVASPQQVSESDQIPTEDDLDQRARWRIELLDKEEINRLGRLLVLSLTGFLVAGWFLSRAFVMTLFLLGGMAEAFYEMAVKRGMIAPRMKLARVLPYSGGLAICLILMMYIMVRALNLMH
jgi:hypothetical protein